MCVTDSEVFEILLQNKSRKIRI